MRHNVAKILMILAAVAFLTYMILHILAGLFILSITKDTEPGYSKDYVTCYPLKYCDDGFLVGLGKEYKDAIILYEQSYPEDQESDQKVDRYDPEYELVDKLITRKKLLIEGFPPLEKTNRNIIFVDHDIR